MKKLFFVLAIAALGFVSCNNDAANKEAEEKRIADSLSKDSADKAAMNAMPADTTGLNADTANKMAPADTTKK